MGAIVAVLNKKGVNAAETAVVMLEALKPLGSEAYGIASPAVIRIEKCTGTLRDQSVSSPVVVGYAFSKILVRDKPQPLKLEDAALVFDGRIYPANAKDSDAETVARKLQQDREAAAKTLIRKTEGDFAFVIGELERLVAGRDVMGIRPLYYGENGDFAAVACERKALWRIGIERAYSFPPGHVALVDGHGFKFAVAKKLGRPKPKQAHMQAASEKLHTLLERSIKERVAGLREVTVAFSGGLDSSIIAFLAKKSGVDVHLIHVSLENQPETKHAEKMAEELRLPIHSHTYSEKDVREILQKVLSMIEEPDPVKTSIGVPVYWAAEETAKMKFKVMLAGQGADELFGGYKRYVDDYLQYGKEKVQETIFNDIISMYETNFERDFKICNYHDVELRLPFSTRQIAEFAAGLPLDLKIKPSKTTLRKLVLRQVAQNLGLPQAIVERPKRAIQYATGISKALRKIARRKGLAVNEYLQRVFNTTLQR